MRAEATPAERRARVTMESPIRNVDLMADLRMPEPARSSLDHFQNGESPFQRVSRGFHERGGTSVVHKRHQILWSRAHPLTSVAKSAPCRPYAQTVFRSRCTTLGMMPARNSGTEAR
jgi:hypothetical protein